jgi:cell pole-organizing protein PopZ
MAEQSADNEPSMEEILSSIRRIINEDEDEPAADAAAEAAPEPAAGEDLGQGAVDDMFDAAPAADVAEEESDVLELTDMVDEDSGGTAPVSMDDDLMIIDRDEEIVMEPAPEPEPEIDFAALEGEVEAGIMGEPATTAATGSFHQLADSIRVSEEEGRTLEGVVRALIRPMLKEWLDSNLPAIVDDKVQAEIDRVARRRR